MQQKQSNLLELIYTKEDQQLQQIKKRLSDFAKYFFNLKRNITIIYDRNMIYIIHKDYLKILELSKAYVITHLAYNYEKNVVLFLTVQGGLYAFFANGKFIVQIKKECRKMFVMDWIYGSSGVAHFFVAESHGVYLYKYQEEKRCFKEAKHLSGKYHCFLYEPTSELLVGFPYGDCQTANLFHFDASKAKNWFKSGQLELNYQRDQVITERIRKTKSFGLESSTSCREVFTTTPLNEDYFIDCLRIYNICYICFYMAGQGKLKLTPIDESLMFKPVIIKLPSDSVPIFNIVDNMLAVHLKNEKITFLYDISPTSFQTLVSPYPIAHQDDKVTREIIYQSHIVGRRVVLTNGRISKWKINLSVIFHFLKNQLQIFQFFNNRANSKMEIIRWLRSNLFTIKPINLSRIWKYIFSKNEKGIHDESDIVTILELYSNLFYTLSLDPLIDKEALTNILLECIRQGNEFHVKLPDELQLLTAQLLLQTRKYEMMTYLCHHKVIKPDKKISELIFEESQKSEQQILLTLSIDMAYYNLQAKDFLQLLIQTSRLRQAKRYIRYHSQKMEVLDMVGVCALIKSMEERKEFVKFIRSFITQKYPSMNTIYLDEAQKKVIEGV